MGDLGLTPGLGRSPGGGHGNSLQYSCLKNPCRQRSLVGYSPWGRKQSDMTEQLSTGKAVLPGWVLVSIVQPCLTLCNPMDWTVVLQAFLSMGILQARILECIAVPFSRESSWPRGWTQVSCIAGKSFTSWATREAPCGEGYTNTNPANKVISENAMKRFTGWSMMGLRARFF